ncbi:MAG: UDP-N-acetylmuramoyl-tripeptide--D-alanyl-D-alanine ligase [Patescibacteria group bacterium]
MKRYLTILQLEGYDLLRFIKWLIRNLFSTQNENKVKLVYTIKIKLIIFVSILIEMLIVFKTFNSTHNFLLIVSAFTIMYLGSFVIIILATLILKPLDILFRIYEITFIKNKLLSNKNLKIVGITGSYGKTSTKEILYQLIKSKYKTLRTPESYNTISGIKKTLDFELDSSYEVFICEMSAYKKGDIKNLCKIINPTHGILTGITTQHLERFGSLQNIVKTKFELYDAIDNKQNIIFNTNSIEISEEIKSRNINDFSEYVNAKNIVFSKSGSEFEITFKNKKYKVSTKLFGYSNIDNIMGALTMALKLGIDIDYLINKIENLAPVQSRFVLKENGNSMVVDNTFSSNEQSFYETIKTAEETEGKKLLITPGLVELGKNEESINNKVGIKADIVFDKIILVGKNSRTIAFSKDFRSKPIFIKDSRKDYFETIERLKSEFDWIFLENDVTQNYN